MTRLTNPLPMFTDASGTLLDGGFVYIGVMNGDPETQPVAVFFDANMTIPASQPLRTLGGFVVNQAAPSQVFFAETDYSIRVRDADGNVILYQASSYPLGADYQPRDEDLTAIADAGTTAYGRALLGLVNQSALKQATGIPDSLPIVGGTVSGAIVRASAGRYLHQSDTSLPGDTLYRGTAEPTGGADGDLYFQYTG